MELSVKIFNETSIITQDNCKFISNIIPTRYLRKSNHILFTCVDNLCPARITLTTDKDRILSADLQHNHAIGELGRNSKSSKNKTNKSTKSANESIVKAKTKTPNINKPTSITNSKPPSVTKSLAKVNSKKENKSFDTQTPKSSNNTLTRKSNKSITDTSLANTRSPNTPAASLISIESVDKVSREASPNEQHVSRSGTKSGVKSPCVKSPNNNQQGVYTNSNSNVPSRKTKVVIITDSMGRGFRELLSATLPNIEVTANIYPNGKFNQCLENAEQICSGLTKQDFVYIMCGTNNTCTLSPNSCPRFNLTPIRNIQKKTNVIISSILYRHDSLSFQNTNICFTNEYLGHMCQGIRVNFLQCNAFVKRRHFTRHGLHLNLAGKRVVCAKLKSYILSLSMSLDSSTTTGTDDIINLLDITCPFNESFESTFSDFPPPLTRKSAGNVSKTVVDLTETPKQSQTLFRLFTP
ncbi:hypothetical protein M8J77_023376 [Diaphorina citri]|nr:hypothetical protein M8J77_023376 [Diaphorina citri]